MEKTMKMSGKGIRAVLAEARQPDIFDYLAWRADVPFSVDPFNEVDNLILSELAYADLSGVVPPDGAEIPVKDAFEGFFRLHTREEILASKSYTARAPLLMEPMVGFARFGDMRLRWYMNEISRREVEQLSAVTCILPGNVAYVAFRGTDDTVVGWQEDFNFSFLSETTGQRRAVEYLNKVGYQWPGEIIVGGHSKGGNFAVYAAAFADPGVQKRIRAVYSNDGPGFRREVLEAPGYGRILPLIHSIIPDTSVVGQLLSTRAVPRVIKSNARGIFQHDGFSWCVQRSGFQPSALTVAGELIRETLGGWLEQMDDEARKSFTGSIFSLFEATGRDTLSAISQQKWKSAEAILSAIRAMPREQQQEILRILGCLGQKSGQATADYLTGVLMKKIGEEPGGIENGD